MEFIKRQRIGSWLTLAALALTVVSLILYCVGSTAAGYFRGTLSGGVITMTVLSLLLLGCSLVLAQVNYGGTLGKCLETAADVMRVAATVLLTASLLVFLSQRVEGLAYIYGSNADVSAEVQTPENLASSAKAIAGFVFYGLSWLVSAVAAFFDTAKRTRD